MKRRSSVRPGSGRAVLLAALLCVSAPAAAQVVFTDTFNNGSVADADNRPGFWTQVVSGTGVFTETPSIPGITLSSQSAGPGNTFPFTQIASPLQNDFNFFRAPIRIRVDGLGFAPGDSLQALTQFNLTSEALTEEGPGTEWEAEDSFSIWVANRNTANNGLGYGTLVMGTKQDAPFRSTVWEGFPILGPIGNHASTQVFPGQIRALDLRLGATFYDLTVTHDASPTDPTPVFVTYRGGLDIHRVDSPFLANWSTATNPQGDSAFNIQTQLNNVPTTTPVANFSVGSVTIERFARSWVGPTGAVWSDPAAWSDPDIQHVNADLTISSVPNFVSAAVRFPQTSAPTTVVADLDRTLGNLVIDSTQPYTLTVDGLGQGTLNLASRFLVAEITVASGSGHTIFNPVIFRAGSDALLSAEASDASVTIPYFTLEFPATQNLTKIGPGRVDVGTVSSNALSVLGGTLRMLPQDGTFPGMFSGPSVVESLSATGGLLDLTSNDLIVRDGVLAEVRAAVASWWNGGARDGAGLGTSLSVPASHTTLGVLGTVSDLGITEFDIFAGVPVGALDVLVKYTYLGDTNLDGILDARDFNAVLSGITNGLSGWENGDLNYDGIANIDDWALFIPAYEYFLTSGVPLGGPGLTGIIPEPATGLALLALAPLTLRRRR